MNSQITFLVFTFNEERRLENYLRCIQGWGRIVVVDNKSTDKTCEIASHYTDQIYTFCNPGYVENKETMDFALSKITTQWVYLGYVDELLPKPLLEQLTQISQGNRYKIVEIYRKNFMYGQEVFNYGKHHLRMFVPDAVDFTDNIVHKLGKFLASKNQIYKIPASDQTSLWHFSSYNTCKLELTHNRYANIEAKQRHEILKQRFSGIRAIWKFVFHFCGTYIGLGGFRGGWPGFFISLQIAYYKFSIEARLWEYDAGITLESIEKSYDERKESLINYSARTVPAFAAEQPGIVAQKDKIGSLHLKSEPQNVLSQRQEHGEYKSSKRSDIVTLKKIKQKVFGWILWCLFSSSRDRVAQIFIKGRCQFIWESEHVSRKIKLHLFETKETRFFEHYIKKGDICFDVGANVGYYTNLFASITGKSGKVFSVEPLLRNVRLIELAAAINKTDEFVKVLRMCASNEDTEVGFSSNGDSSYASVNIDSEKNTETVVQCKKIDSIVSDFNLPKIDILKMDVEGWEYHALQGMKGVLADPQKRPRLMMIELYPDHLKKYSNSIAEICEFLSGFGYAPYFLGSIEQNKLLPFTKEQYEKIYNIFFILNAEVLFGQ